jgi:hypothetical protein
MALTHMVIVGRIEQHLRDCENCKQAVVNIDARAIATCLSRDNDVAEWLQSHYVTAEGLEAIILVHVGTFYHSEVKENRQPVHAIEDGNYYDLYAYAFYQAGLHFLTCYECRYGLAHMDSEAVAAHIMLDSVLIQAIETEEIPIGTLRACLEVVLQFMYSLSGDSDEQVELARRAEQDTERWLENDRRSDNQVWYDNLADEAATMIRGVAAEMERRSKHEVHDYKPFIIMVDEQPTLYTPPIEYPGVAPEVISTIQHYIELHITECATCKLTITIPNETAIADCIAHADVIEEYLYNKISRNDLYAIVKQYLQDKPLYLVDHTPDGTPVKVSWNALHQVAIAGKSPTTYDLRCHVIIQGNQCHKLVRNQDVYGRCLNCSKPTCGEHSVATPDDIEQAMLYISNPGEITSLGNLDGRICYDCLMLVDNPFSTHALTLGDMIAELSKRGYQDVTPEERYRGASADYCFKSPLGGVCYCYNNQQVHLLLEAVRRVGSIETCVKCGNEQTNLCQYCGTCSACYPGTHTPCLAGVPYIDRDSTYTNHMHMHMNAENNQ